MKALHGLRLLLPLPLLAPSPWPAAAQAPPELPQPMPDQYPDLQADGEWWFYKLLDTSFPHDVLPTLPASAVSAGGGGEIHFTDLPDAQYVVLEFFAPWCPHCQHFAPEMAKVVQVLQSPQARAGALVAARAVDCEKLELKPACYWAEAFVMPKLIIARREVLVGTLGPTAKQTAGVSELFPVSEAAQVMAFLAENVPELPADVPMPAPRDEGAPFLGWSQPLAGSEPHEVPTQDVMVAVVSLLHQAFSRLTLDDDARNALFDFLLLLCAAGPGGTCRQSACAMRDGLIRDWSQLVSQVSITKDPEGNPITPFTVTHLDWARVEHEHQWCDRPWPDFAQQSWDWCQGRTPGTRGYTCGLWVLFHSLLVGAEKASTQPAGTTGRRLDGLPRPALEIIRDTIRFFFGCQECRDHFLAVPLDPAVDLATPESQILWLWSAHNMATVRIGEEERSHSASAPPRSPWPSQAACPQCYADDGSFVTGEVANALRRFYGGVFGDGGSGGGAPTFTANLGQKFEIFPFMAPAPPTQPVVVKVFYYTLCPHCEYAFKLAIAPLVEARLPGDKVQIGLVPMYPPLLQARDNEEMCRSSSNCNDALAPLCALRQTAFRPSPADSAALLQGARFARCDLASTAEGKGRDPAATQACAAEAGLDFAALKACYEGPEGMQLLRSASEPLLAAMTSLHDGAGFREPPSMPWILLGDDLLSCDGEGARCTAVLKPAGLAPLPKEGTLLELVCAHLDPATPGCTRAGAVQKVAQAQAEKEAGGAAAERLAEKKAAACENCAEVGAFRWQHRDANLAVAHPAWSLPLLAGAASVAAATCAIAWRSARSRSIDGAMLEEPYE